MDYNKGTNLKKYQWDGMRSQEAMVSWMEGEEEFEAKNLLNSKYVIVHDELSEKAYASKKGDDAFTQGAITEVDAKLEELYKADKKTYIYIAYIWFDASNIDDFDNKIEKAFKGSFDVVKRKTGETSFNLLTIVNAKFDVALGEGKKSVSFRELFTTISGLDQSCLKSINDYLNSAEKKKFVDGLDDALRERARRLTELLSKCDVKNSSVVYPATLSSGVNTAAQKAVEDVLTYKKIADPSCNLCTRQALLNLKGDPVLFPKSGSYVYFTYDKDKDPVIKGEISGDGSATQIVNDFADYKNNELVNYFEEIVKDENTSFEDFWKGIQERVDKGEIIIGTYSPRHVFMVVPGGLYKVANNIEHTIEDHSELQDNFKDNPKIELGDKYGWCFAGRGIQFVPRILECGSTVKSDNAPLYANMDYRGSTTKLKWFKYIK
jgi:hypothetical protein